ncbi:hypothetical protein BRADI_1g72563v3 [Brachypodium distachyon]|uniref:Uncharacterized protein n=1 Tax=Brachypodium distachyon TaxID=15368 RepID=A0A2K2DUS5_BRADI|nr:hypothetical protein BRADI_1g72563v3 [Brachypodium distachyon]
MHTDSQNLIAMKKNHPPCSSGSNSQRETMEKTTDPSLEWREEETIYSPYASMEPDREQGENAPTTHAVAYIAIGLGSSS